MLLLYHQRQITLGYNLAFQTQPSMFLSWEAQHCLPSTQAPKHGTAGTDAKGGMRFGLLLELLPQTAPGSAMRIPNAQGLFLCKRK